MSINQAYGNYMREAAIAGKDTCGKRHLNTFVGTGFDAVDIRQELPQRYIYRVSDVRDVSPEGTIYVFTSDLRHNRMSIYVDKMGNIDRLKCG